MALAPSSRASRVERASGSWKESLEQAVATQPELGSVSNLLAATQALQTARTGDKQPCADVSNASRITKENAYQYFCMLQEQHAGVCRFHSSSDGWHVGGEHTDVHIVLAPELRLLSFAAQTAPRTVSPSRTCSA